LLAPSAGAVLAWTAPSALYHPVVAENAHRGSRGNANRGSRGNANRSSRGAVATAEQVASIVGAAEAAAERMRLQAEKRLNDRIAEGERAAENRVQAAEEEAAEILELAQQEAARLREAGRADAEKAVAEATSEALAILARAQENAESTVNETSAAAAKALEEAEERSRELLRDARTNASDVRTEGLELVGNLREMGDSLRSNAERLLRDVQLIHSRMVAQIDRVDGGAGRAAGGSLSRRTGARSRGGGTGPGDEDVLDVPEFIPPG
jgi:vacuolar-type H+-ATPase subunit H